MADVVVVTPNPAVDVTYDVDRQVVGETVRVRRVWRRAGGKGVNVARVLHTLGVDVLAVHPSAGSGGAWVQVRLASEGIRSVGVPVPGETRTTVTTTDAHSHPTVLAEPGPAVPAVAWTRLGDVFAQHCRPGSVAVVAGSLPAGSAPERIAELVGRGRAAGARVVVDVSGPGLLSAARAGADVLTPNADEAMAATGTSDLVQACDALRALGARELVVSCGADGLVAVDVAGRRCRQAAVRGVAGNPTGAGDAATAGLVTGLLHDMPLSVTLRWAALLGAAAVLRPVAGDVHLDDVAVLSAGTSVVDEDQRRFPIPPFTAPAPPDPTSTPHPDPREIL